MDDVSKVRLSHAWIQEFSSGGGGGPGQSDKKALTTFFFFFKSSAYFKELKWSISKKYISFFKEGVQHFPGGPTFSMGGGGGGPIAYSL